MTDVESTSSSSVARASSRDIVLAATDIERSFKMGREIVHVLKGASMQLQRGEIVSIMGRSGAGKSTLLHLLGLIDRPDGGSLSVAGIETAGMTRARRSRLRNREIGFIFQFYHLLPELTALQNVLLPQMIENGPFAWLRRKAAVRERARALLDDLGLGDRGGHVPGQLSGGERQRVAIARALMSEPSVLLCDEPTGNLDERSSDIIADLLFDLARRHDQTLVLVTHDPDLAKRSDRSLVLQEGRLDPA